MKPVARVTDKFDVVTFLADQYLLESINSIDKRLGQGYAKKNPQLVSTMVKVMQDCSFVNEGQIAVLN
jgi:hypothetical protein|tara:strand:- start:12197 stop:12400 length:204 start_codon:yes stop_codon:yes gene_type:complete